MGMIKYRMIQAMNLKDLEYIKNDYEYAKTKYEENKTKSKKEKDLKIYFAAYIKSLETLIEYFIVWLGKQIYDHEKNKEERKSIEEEKNIKNKKCQEFEKKYIPAYFSIDSNLNIAHKARLLGIIDKDDLENLKKMNTLRNRVLVHGYYETMKRYNEDKWFDIKDKQVKKEKINEEKIEKFIEIVTQKIEEKNSE